MNLHSYINDRPRTRCPGFVSGRRTFRCLRYDIQTGSAALPVTYTLDNDKGGRRVILNTLKSLLQVSPTECGVPECDRESSIMRRAWPSGSCCVIVNNDCIISPLYFAALRSLYHPHIVGL
jgi:hypothetical protein